MKPFRIMVLESGTPSHQLSVYGISGRAPLHFLFQACLTEDLAEGIELRFPVEVFVDVGIDLLQERDVVVLVEDRLLVDDVDLSLEMLLRTDRDQDPQRRRAQLVAHLASQQVIDRLAQRLADDVPAGHLQGTAVSGLRDVLLAIDEDPADATIHRQAARIEDPADDDDVRPDGSYVGVALGNWMLTAGWQDRFWGPSRDGSLILLVTPKRLTPVERHKGCRALELESIRVAASTRSEPVSTMS